MPDGGFIQGSVIAIQWCLITIGDATPAAANHTTTGTSSSTGIIPKSAYHSTPQLVFFFVT